jgi:hypothetical protein
MEKTNYLYFRQKGSQSFTATGSQTDFTLADDGTGSFDQDFSDASNNEDHIEVTSNGSIVGDIIEVTAVPREGTEVAFRADRFLGVRSTSDTVTVISFKAGDDESFATTNDFVTLTHTATTVASDAAKLIAAGIEEAINAETATGFVSVLDREAGDGTLTTKNLTFSNLQLNIEA